MEDEIEQLSAQFEKAISLVGQGAFKASDGDKLKLYGFFKQATVGKCNTPKPGFFDFVGKSKWEAWNSLSNVSKEAAMKSYIQIVDALAPGWRAQDPTTAPTADASQKQGGGKGGWGPVFSQMRQDDSDANEAGSSTICDFAADGDQAKVAALLKSGTDVNWKDEEARTALHMAVDREHIEIVSFLLDNGADLNAQDGLGQTPLHYAAVCEHTELVQLLVRRGANTNLQDSDGLTPSQATSNSEIKELLQ